MWLDEVGLQGHIPRVLGTGTPSPSPSLLLLETTELLRPTPGPLPIAQGQGAPSRPWSADPPFLLLTPPPPVPRGDAVASLLTVNSSPPFTGNVPSSWGTEVSISPHSIPALPPASKPSSWSFSSSLPLLVYFHLPSPSTQGFPRWLSGKKPSCQCRRGGFNPWAGKSPWRRKWQPIPVCLPGESHRQRSLAGYSSRICKESDTP